MPQRHFYATAEDLLPVFEQVESKHRVAYTLMGVFTSSKLTTVFRGADLPTLKVRLAQGDASICPEYLVMPFDAQVQVEQFRQNDGQICFAVDQRLNADSITFSHGGFFRDDVLLYGRVATISKSSVAARLERAYSSAIAKHFVRVRAFYVGPNAMAYSKRGCRLTIGANSPREYDLQVGA